MNITFPFNFKATKVVVYDELYGSHIHEQNAPVFSEWGLGKAGELPAPAYEHIKENVLEAALALFHFGGQDAYAARTSAHWLEFKEIDNLSVKGAMLKALDIGYPFVEGDILEAVVHRGTREVVCYYFHVQGDGTAALFSAEHV